jgi:hypothetical protein
VGDSAPASAYRDCVEACANTADACDLCVARCLQHPDVQSLARCIQLCLDAAMVSRTTAALMRRESEFADTAGHFLAQLCEACAAECERHDEHAYCRWCASMCRRCAAACGPDRAAVN